MAKSNSFKAGRHFLQIPGPTNIPDRVLRAMDRAIIDHRGPEFGELGKRVLDKIKAEPRSRRSRRGSPRRCARRWRAGCTARRCRRRRRRGVRRRA